jgi:CRISPR-associated protein Csy1
MTNLLQTTWKELISQFLQNKQDAEEERYIKEILKSIAAAYEKESYFLQDDIRTFFDAKKNKKPDHQSALDFQREKYDSAKKLLMQPENLDWEKIESDYLKKRESLSSKYRPSVWLKEASEGAGSVSFASHVAKLTHSKIDTPSIFDQVDSVRKEQLSTTSLHHKTIDGAVKGNQFAPIFQFLELELEGTKLAQVFQDETNDVLAEFSDNSDQLRTWNEGFKQSLVSREISAHSLLKQIYFPTFSNGPKQDSEYHLLVQMTSSTLAHALYEEFFRKHELVEKSYGKQCFHESEYIRFPNKSVISVTASNHSNASQLNGKRGGKLYLLPSSPPIWESQKKPPLYHRSWFERGVPKSAVEDVLVHICNFLIRFESLELSVKNPQRYRWLIKWGMQLLSTTMVYAEIVQDLPPGWSASSKTRLKIEHQFFLDPYREDDAFQEARKSTDWEQVVCSDFARWVNRKLVSVDKSFAPQREHTRLWKRLMEKELRVSNQMINSVNESQGKG